MEQKIYYASESSNYLNNEKAQVYGPCIAKIIDANGGIATTQIIVENAKDKSSPIHDHFQWDDTKAANEYRKYQARKLIQSIEVEIVKDGQSSQIVRAFHFIKKEDEEEVSQGFARFEVIHKKADLYNEFVLKAYLKRIRQLNSKYKKYKELEPIVIAIDEILERHIEVMEVV